MACKCNKKACKSCTVKNKLPKREYPKKGKHSVESVFNTKETAAHYAKMSPSEKRSETARRKAVVHSMNGGKDNGRPVMSAKTFRERVMRNIAQRKRRGN